MKYIYVITLEIYSIDEFQFVALSGHTSHARAWKTILDLYSLHKSTLTNGYSIYDVNAEKDPFSFAVGDELETIRRYQYTIKKVPFNSKDIYETSILHYV